MGLETKFGMMLAAVGLATSITGAVEFGSLSQNIQNRLNVNDDYRRAVNYQIAANDLKYARNALIYHPSSTYWDYNRQIGNYVPMNHPQEQPHPQKADKFINNAINILHDLPEQGVSFQLFSLERSIDQKVPIITGIAGDHSWIYADERNQLQGWNDQLKAKSNQFYREVPSDLTDQQARSSFLSAVCWGVSSALLSLEAVLGIREVQKRSSVR